MTVTTIARFRLAELLKVCESTLRNWERKRVLSPIRPSKPGKELFYRISTVNKKLAQNSSGFDTPPTVEDLETGRVTLLSPSEAKHDLKTSSTGVMRLKARRHIAVVSFGANNRICEASVKRFLDSKADSTKQYNRKELAHVGGVSQGVVSRLVHDGRLQQHEYVTHRLCVAQPSLIAYLGEQLPTGCDPHEWLKAREQSSKPVVSMSEVERHAYARTDMLFSIKEGRIVTIRHPYNNQLILAPETWLEYICETEKPLTLRQIGRFFGAGQEQVEQWDRQFKDWRLCELHDHPDDTLYPTCMLGIIRRYICGEQSPRRWYKRADRPMVTPQTIAHDLGVKIEAVHKTAHNGLLPAIRRPNGRIVCTRPEYYHKQCILRAR
ncbi:MAG TPA: hypothetical protein VFO38_02785 [Candidatus Saccharimonadales bacterium]|nr:hypothetical protein [Candidatus Saccharimonadales bacterium]